MVWPVPGALHSSGVQCTCRQHTKVPLTDCSANFISSKGNTTIKSGPGAMLAFWSEFLQLIGLHVFLNSVFWIILIRSPLRSLFSLCFKGLAVTWNNMFASFHLWLKLFLSEETYIDFMLVFIRLGFPAPSVHFLAQSILSITAQPGAAFLSFQVSCPLEAAGLSVPWWSFFTFLKEAVLVLPVLKSNMQLTEI